MELGKGGKKGEVECGRRKRGKGEEEEEEEEGKSRRSDGD